MADRPPPVVMVSSLTSEGAEATLRALELGAVDFIAKLEVGMASLWAGDAGYDDVDPIRPGPRHRLSMVPGGWIYEDTISYNFV